MIQQIARAQHKTVCYNFKREREREKKYGETCQKSKSGQRARTGRIGCSSNKFITA